MRPAGLACPTCHGSLFNLPGAPAPRYCCRVGHEWSPQSLLAEQGSAFEGTLWMALRSIEERAALEARMSEAARRRGAPAMRHEQTEEWARQTSRLIRELIERWGSSGGWPHDGEPAG
jgi:two-component system chemotaxis response regulator CheB